MIAIGVGLAIAPFARFLIVYPARKLSIWLAKVMPEGRLKRALLKNRGELKAYEISPKLPPPPYP